MQARTADMLSESRRLRAALQISEARSGLVQQFLQQYQLSHDEVYALKVRRSAGGCHASLNHRMHIRPGQLGVLASCLEACVHATHK